MTCDTLMGARNLDDHVRTKLLPADGLRVGIEAEEHALVGKGVLVLSPGTPLSFRPGRANDGLDLRAVNDAGNIRVGDLRRRKAGVGSQN
jgi:hypothetical protein